ncbi:MAG: DUF2508 family protein [Clostridia bacterium]|nr:DUF2508 family protein [Clostridia bacterium]
MFSELSSSLTATFTRIISPKKKQEQEHEIRIRELIANIEDTKSEIQRAMDNFNNVTEPKLIDFYIYKIQSEQTRFEHLISEYKTLYNSISSSEG